MAAPVLTITAIPQIANGSDLTALTGGISGDTGADWGFGTSITHGKFDGGAQCVPSLISGASFLTGSFAMGTSVSYSDQDNSPDPISSGSTSSGYNIDASIGSGFYFTLKADQAKRKFRWFGNTNGGNWRVTASLSDGSKTPVTLDIPDYPGTPGGLGSGFLVTYTSVDPNATCDVRFIKQVATAGVTCGQFCRYVEVPTPPARPRGLSLARMFLK